MDTLHKPEDPQITRKSPHRMSIQCHNSIQLGTLIGTSPVPKKSKSLPNIRMLGNNDNESAVHCIVSSSSTLEPEVHKRDLLCSQQHHSTQHKPKILKKTWDKVKTIIHNPPLGSSVRRESLRKSETRAPLQRSNAMTSSAPSTPLDAVAFEFEEACAAGGDERQRIARNYALLQKRLSEELHQRMNECSKSSGNVGGDDSGRVSLHGGNRFPEHLSDEFRKRLQQWEMWKASTGKAHYTDEELREIVPEDFGRKLVEWEVIRGGGQLEGVGGVVNEESITEAGGGAERVRKSSKRKFNFGSNSELPQTQHQKELAWLDKQLEKIEGEKKRLEREMKKYLEREARLEKMKEALKNSPSTDVYIKTPTAKCRVEKITEKFAKKLYEWEEKQGIGPESSTLGLLNPKYYAEAQEDVAGNIVLEEGEVENREVLDKEDVAGEGDVEEDEEEILGPLDLINARLKAAEEEETEQDKSVRRAMEHVAEALALADEEVVGIVREGEGRVSSTASSCCCSAEYEYDQTDSFATKNNSGASNTDSEFYSNKPDPNKLCTNARRRSSDAISTPLSGDARSPSLSAFTSDDEGDGNNGPLLRRVSEEDDAGCGGSGGGPSVSRHSTMRNAAAIVGSSCEGEQVKDAESQTDVVVRAKQIVVEDEDNCGNDERAWDSSNGIFVPTKRTIFAPIVGELDSEKVVLIREDIPMAGAVVHNGGRGDDNVVARFSTSSASIPSISSPGFGGKQEEDDDEEDKPRIVGAIPKRPTHLTIQTAENPILPHPYKPQPKTQLHRSFPKMGKIPVWCSPLVARKQMFSSHSSDSEPQHQQQQQIGGSVTSEVSVTTPDDSDFSIDRFLQDSKLLDAAMNACVTGGNNDTPVESQDQGSAARVEVNKRSVLCSRLPKTNALLPRKYTIGGGYPPRSGCVLTRSNSFGYPKGGGGSCGGGGGVAGSVSTSNVQDQYLQPPPVSSLAGGSNITLESFSSVHLPEERSTLQSVSAASMHSVTKSKSTGSIKSRFGRAFARVGFGFGGSLGKDTKGNKLGRVKSDESSQDQESEVSGGNEQGPLIPNSPGPSYGGQGGERGGATTIRRDSSSTGVGEASGSGSNNTFAGMNPLRRFGSWVSRVGGGGSSSSGGGGGGGGMMTMDTGNSNQGTGGTGGGGADCRE